MSTSAEVSGRVAKVAEMISDLFDTEDIILFGMEEWKVCQATIYNYLTEAWKIAQRGRSQNETIEDALAYWVKLRETARDKGDVRSAGIFQREICKLLGLYPKKGETKIPVQNVNAEPNIEELQERLAKVREEAKNWEPPKTLKFGG